ncbi:murein transglycosylase A [Oricola thermophila]|nr:MltA domain-containing protein [Oricola thermophila]
MWRLRPLPFDALSGWAEDDHAAALRTFSRHANRPAGESYRCGTIGITPESLEPLFERATEPAALADPRGFFEAHFDCCALVGSDRERGFVTAFYEPRIGVSRTRTERFREPFYRRPDDLVPVTSENRPSGWDEAWRFARRAADGTLLHYPDRAAIDAGWLEGRGLEIAWAEDPVDVFFAHVQGAARLEFVDGGETRVTYDGKNGHAFTAIGRLLVDRGEIDPTSVSMTAIRRWLADHPGEARQVMQENRSYIFFRETSVADEADGPVAAAKVPLTANRSLAVDRLLHTFGSPVFVTADRVNGRPWRRLMIAQDTGSAIVGPARGDLFMGSGDEAGARAAAVRSAADFCLLVPKSLHLPAGMEIGP